MPPVEGRPLWELLRATPPGAFRADVLRIILCEHVDDAFLLGLGDRLVDTSPTLLFRERVVELVTRQQSIGPLRQLFVSIFGTDEDWDEQYLTWTRDTDVSTLGQSSA